MYTAFLPFLSFSLVRFMQPRRSAPKDGDNVMATRDCGRVTAILYSQLATRLRSLAIILPIHLYLLSLESMFATVYHNYHTYAYKAERWRTCPYKNDPKRPSLIANAAQWQCNVRSHPDSSLKDVGDCSIEMKNMYSNKDQNYNHAI